MGDVQEDNPETGCTSRFRPVALFLFFIDDLRWGSGGLHVTLFADDVAVFVWDSKLHVAEARLQHVLDVMTTCIREDVALGPKVSVLLLLDKLTRLLVVTISLTLDQPFSTLPNP